MCYTCAYCKKEYKTEKGLRNHKCLKRDRMEQFMDTPYKTFLQMCMVYKIPIVGVDEEKKKKFIGSKEYKFITKLSNWYNDITEIPVGDYFMYLKQYQIPAINWINDYNFREFIKKYVNEENKLVSIERSTNYIKQFSYSFDFLSCERIITGLTSGMITKHYLKEYNIDLHNFLTQEEYKTVEDLL